MFTEVFGLGRAAALSAVISILVVLVLGIFLFFYLAPPNTITITSGPEGSTFRRTAGRYAKILQRNGVTLLQGWVSYRDGCQVYTIDSLIRL